MEDAQIIELFLNRVEQCIEETRKKYGMYCFSIAFRILRNREDAMECENDTYFKAWHAIPPQRPQILSAFLGKITRNLSLDRYEKEHAKKRGSGEISLIWEELEECITDNGDKGDNTDRILLQQILSQFLDELSSEARYLFIRRYWYAFSIREIAESRLMSENKVKMNLFRSREKLKRLLEQEGIWI